MIVGIGTIHKEIKFKKKKKKAQSSLSKVTLYWIQSQSLDPSS